MKIAIVTGASSGLGREFVRQITRLYKNLDEIWVVARRAERLEELKEKLPVYIRVFAGDMEEDLIYKQVLNRLENQNPDVRMLVNAAGFGKMGTIEEIAAEDKKLQLRMIDLNCRGRFPIVARTTAGRMKRCQDSIRGGDDNRNRTQILRRLRLNITYAKAKHSPRCSC